MQTQTCPSIENNTSQVICILYFSKSFLYLYSTTNMNTDKYISVLDDNLWPVVVRHFSDRPWIFQEGNAPCHVSLRANQWKEENGIRKRSSGFLQT
jgi:hypothetical protein